MPKVAQEAYLEFKFNLADSTAMLLITTLYSTNETYVCKSVQNLYGRSKGPLKYYFQYYLLLSCLMFSGHYNFAVYKENTFIFYYIYIYILILYNLLI